MLWVLGSFWAQAFFTPYDSSLRPETPKYQRSKEVTR